MGLGGPGQGGIEDDRKEALVLALRVDELQEGAAELLRIGRRRRKDEEGGQRPAEEKPLNPLRS